MGSPTLTPAMRDPHTSFARLVSLACHDLRTPLATVLGFARTLERYGSRDERELRYLQLMQAACEQMTELLDDLGLAARIEGGRYEAVPEEVDTLALAHASAQRVEEGSVRVAGSGGRVLLDREPSERALAALARAALRHGSLRELDLVVDGASIGLRPVTAAARPIVLGEDVRDLGAAVAVRVLAALGACLELAGELLVVRFERSGVVIATSG